MRKVTAAEQQERDLDLARTHAHNRIKQAHAEALESIESRYSMVEKIGWHRLDKALDKYQSEGTVTNGLQMYADSLGVSVEDAVARLGNAIQAFDGMYSEATGKLTRLRDAVDAAESVEELEAITW